VQNSRKEQEPKAAADARTNLPSRSCNSSKVATGRGRSSVARGRGGGVVVVTSTPTRGGTEALTKLEEERSTANVGGVKVAYPRESEVGGG
jgi:hypothetical protein